MDILEFILSDSARPALRNAPPIARMVLMTEALVVEKPEKKSNGDGGGGHDDYDM
jgi:hypothetical protein